MAFLKMNEDVNLYYEDKGTGTPVIFIHGVWMSSRFFHKQMDYFKNDYRALTLDLRGHGQSSHVPYGHTISSYANDLQMFMEKLQLKDVILIGWSMGAFVIWEYIKQFGEDNIKGTVIVDELPSDFKWPDFEIGAFTLETLVHFMQQIQTDRLAFIKGFIPLMFKKDLSEDEMQWMVDEVTKLPEAIASAILFDQSVVDYRNMLSTIQKPSLLCFGREEKLIPVAAGEYLKEHIPQSELVIFENSCHCPFIEEEELFNQTVVEFINKINI